MKFLFEDKEMYLLEAIISSVKNFSKSVTSGVFVSCGDILVNTQGIELNDNSNSLFAVKSDIETGTRHGVMFCDECGKLDTFAHKESKDVLLSLSKKYKTENILIDTGMVYFCDRAVVKILNSERENGVFKKLYSAHKELSLYNDIIPALARKRINNDKNVFYGTLEDETADVKITDGEFVHFGTTRETLKNVLKLSDKVGVVSLNSILNKTDIKDNSFTENTVLKNCMVGENSIVTDVSLNNKSIGDNKAVCGFKLKNGKYVTIMMDIDENPKSKINDKEIWHIPRFFEGKSFDESFDKLTENSKGDLSFDDILKSADYNFYFDNAQYIRDKKSSLVSCEYEKMREEIIKDYFLKNKKLESISAVQDFSQIKLPVRVNLCGTWTDAMPYCCLNGGEVINIAVTLDGNLPIVVTVEKINGNRIELVSDGVKTEFSFDEKENADMMSDFILHTAALSALGIDKNTKINTAFRLTTRVENIDKGSGLGTSSILLAGCMKSLSDFFGLDLKKEDIIKKVFVAEQIMKTGGGWQDQAGAVFGGAKIIRSLPGISQNVEVEKIKLKEEFKKELFSRLFLIPTSQRHFGRFIVSDVAQRYLENKGNTRVGLEKIKKLNVKCNDALKNGNIKVLVEVLNKHTELLKMISPAVTNDNIELICEKLKKVCDAVSICGAGGGGYLLVLVKENINISNLENYISNELAFLKGDIKRINIFE